MSFTDFHEYAFVPGIFIGLRTLNSNCCIIPTLLRDPANPSLRGKLCMNWHVLTKIPCMMYFFSDVNSTGETSKNQKQQQQQQKLYNNKKNCLITRINYKNHQWSQHNLNTKQLRLEKISADPVQHDFTKQHYLEHIDQEFVRLGLEYLQGWFSGWKLEVRLFRLCL